MPTGPRLSIIWTPDFVIEHDSGLAHDFAAAQQEGAMRLWSCALLTDQDSVKRHGVCEGTRKDTLLHKDNLATLIQELGGNRVDGK